MNSIEKLNSVLHYVKSSFIGKDEIVDLLGISLIARENTFLLGPPGTAKSAIVRRLSDCVVNGKNFEYLLTRFTEPGELFGPFDIRKLKDGELVTNTEGMLPEASMVFLDEIFNANSAILNSLLMALNERIFRRGKETRQLPALMFVGASNLLPEDEALAALLDRFLIRINCNYVDTELLEQVIMAGWNLENRDDLQKPTITPEEIIQLQLSRKSIDLSPIRKLYVDLIRSLRSSGINVSDRRAVKIQNLIAASAVLCGRTEAVTSDLWVMKYIWDTEEQVEILAGMIDIIIRKDPDERSHPQALYNKLPDPEELMLEIKKLEEQWNSDPTPEEQNIAKDKLRSLQNRANWVRNIEHKTLIQQAIDALWKKMLQTI